MAKCCFAFAKIVLFLIDFILLIISLAILGAGIWIFIDSKAFVDTIGFLTRRPSTIIDFYADTEFSFYASTVAIAVGGFLFLICFAGCWGVVSESRCLLIAQSVLVSIVVLLQIACVGTLYSTTSIWMGSVKKTLSDNFNNKYVGSLGTTNTKTYDSYSLSMDAFMISYDCCGINGIADFLPNGPSENWRKKGRIYYLPDGSTKVADEVEIPTACCKFTNTSFFTQKEYHNFRDYIETPLCPVKPKQHFHKRGCLGAIPGEIAKFNNVLIPITVIVFGLEMTTVALAAVLATFIKRWNDELFF